MKKNVDLVRVLRETVGDDTELMFDVHSGWDLTYALAWDKRVEQYRPRWLVEATQAEKIDSFAQLPKGTSIPIASGEHIQGRWEVYDYLKESALSVVQCDPEWCGGLSELQKICTVASIYGVPVIPHGHSLHAVLHLIASQSRGRVSAGGVSDFEDAVVLSFREGCTGPESGALRASGRAGIRHRIRRCQSRIAPGGAL